MSGIMPSDKNRVAAAKSTGCPGNFVGLNIGFTGSRGGGVHRGDTVHPGRCNFANGQRNQWGSAKYIAAPSDSAACLWLYRACRRVTDSPNVISMLEGVTGKIR